jgi:hypothetical protein
MNENDVNIDDIKTDINNRIENIKSKLKYNDAINFENNIIYNYSPKILYNFPVDSLLTDLILILTIIIKLDELKFLNLELYNRYIQIIVYILAVISIIFNCIQYFYYKKIYVTSNRIIDMLNFLFTCYKLSNLNITSR